MLIAYSKPFINRTSLYIQYNYRNQATPSPACTSANSGDYITCMQSVIVEECANMARYECERCGWVGKPIFMEPATRLCPNCRSINVKKVKNK